MQVSATSHSLAMARQIAVEVAKVSPGQAVEVAEHFSETSQAPAALRQVTALAANAVSGPQSPSAAAPPPAALHAWQSVVDPRPHAELQQTPSMQKPESHWPHEVQLAPWPRKEKSSAEGVCVAVEAAYPPAVSAQPFESNTSGWP